MMRDTLEPIINQRVDSRRPMPEPMAMEEAHSLSAQRALQFIDYVGGTEQGNAMLRQFNVENIGGNRLIEVGGPVNEGT